MSNCHNTAVHGTSKSVAFGNDTLDSVYSIIILNDLGLYEKDNLG